LRVESVLWPVADIPIEIFIPCAEAQRVFTYIPPRLRVIVAMPVIIEVCLLIEVLARKCSDALSTPEELFLLLSPMELVVREQAIY